ncbi:MAG: NUDIX hydrolase [Anaerolineae bacterium]
MNLTEEFIAQKLHEAEVQNISGEYTEVPLRGEKKLKCAAVLIPLARVEGEWHLLFTRRTERVEAHKGQVSFPGGACDEGETSPEETALREVEEEIGLRPRQVHLLGRLNPLVTVTYFRVRPVIGVIPWPYTFRVSTIEVARLFTIPLLWLANRQNYWEFPFSDSGRSVIAYHPYDGELLWGATARMTVNFLETIGILK